MTPLSEADREIRDKVVAITGECRCRRDYTDALAIHTKGRPPVYDPSCAYHQQGEHLANLFRENRRLRRSIELLKSRRKGK